MKNLLLRILLVGSDRTRPNKTDRFYNSEKFGLRRLRAKYKCLQHLLNQYFFKVFFFTFDNSRENKPLF